MKKVSIGFLSFLMMLFIFFLSACENGLISQVESARAAAVLPLLTTDAVTSISTATATGGGNITDDGGISVTARGLCWGTEANPDISGNFTVNSGVEKGAFSDLMTGLSPGTLYYVRAYATNSETTGYGEQVSFTTLPASPASITVSPIGYAAGSGKLDVSWEQVSGTNIYYDVYYSQTATRPDAANGPTDLTDTSCTLSGLTNYQTYYVWVVAKNATGSNLLSVKRSEPVAPGIAVTDMNLASRVAVLPGETTQIVINIIPENATNQNVAWASSDTSVATISASGLLTASNVGNSTVTVTVEELGASEDCTVAVTGIITFAGTGVRGTGTSGSSGPATGIDIGYIYYVTLDSAGNVYFSDPDNYCVRKVTPEGSMSTIAGNGISGTPAAGAYAAASSFTRPSGLMVDSSNNIYISDSGDDRIWMMQSSDNTLVHIAGNGIMYDPGAFVEGGLATEMPLGLPSSTVLDAAGNLYFIDVFRYRVRRVDHGTKILSTICGDGVAAFSGDGGAAVSARIHNADGLSIDAAGNFYIADAGNDRIRKISTNGIITTVAGMGGDYPWDYNGDGIAATEAQLHSPSGVVPDASGNIYIADTYNYSIRRVDADGIITTVAGNDTQGDSGDGGPATSAALDTPYGVAVDALGNLYIADTINCRIRKVVR